MSSSPYVYFEQKWVEVLPLEKDLSPLKTPGNLPGFSYVEIDFPTQVEISLSNPTL